MKNCDVCCDVFNKSTRAPISCPYCPFRACSGCSERYLVETSDDAHCMACRKGWSREILVNNFSRKFISQTYKNRREALLLERERSLMPATQPYVETEKEIRRVGKQMGEIQIKLEVENAKWARIAARPLDPLAVEHGLDNQFDAEVIRHELAQAQRKVVNSLSIDIQHLQWRQGRLMWRRDGGSLEHEKRQFVRACPYTDCKGFLSTAWKCGVCENWSCPTCHEGKGPDKDVEHVCNPDNIATAALLARDSRHCPTCAAIIFKIDGCDQMFCTQCHTAFSWRTGRIETGVIHNPHYYEFQRNNGTIQRAPGDVPCGGMPNWVFVNRILRQTEPFLTFVANAHRMYVHCEWVLRPRYTATIQDNRDLRVKFMIGDIDEDEFKRKIQQREKARQRKTDILQVVEMLMAVLMDLFQGYVRDEDATALANALEGLRSHYNTTLETVSKRYSGCAVPKLKENYHLY